MDVIEFKAIAEKGLGRLLEKPDASGFSYVSKPNC